MKATLYLLTFFSVCVGFSLACSCLPRTFPEHYCAADAVLECQFTSRRESRGKIIYNCRIERVHKGNITTRTIQVVTPKSPAACGVTFLTGCNAPTYLITTRMEVISATRNQKVLHINLCDYYDPDPEKPVLEFLRNPSCPCARLQCRPWQKCKVYVRPNCNITAVNTDTVSAVKEGVVSADGDASIDDLYAEREQVTGDLTIRPPTEKTCRVSYCADTCNGFPCPNGTRCRLVDVNCVTQPCPPIARCFKFNPCDTVLCAPNHVCKVDENGQPYCEPQCPVCPPGYHCEKIPVICVRAPCPPQRKCVPDNPIDPCRLQIDVGTYIDNVVSVDDEQERFAFDITKRVCVPFMYRGDGGNDNNFLTLEECERICPNIPPCKQALVVGPCRAAIPRWFHNVTSGKCEQFTYGGCGGNDNNFPSEERCQATCPPPSPCKLKVDTGSNCIGTPKLRWYHDADTRTCKQFNFTGCGGNRNNFGSRTDCEKICPPPNPCVQPRLHGVGNHQSVVVRWWHNPRTLQCEQFKYLGTGGNNNNFLTKAECERRCPPPNPCKLKADPGPCRGAFRRWYYNYQSGRCERFVYGGCGGNANNFKSLRDCHAKCRPIRVCKLPKVVGPCLARIPRWWHNPLTRRCERFWYGGCNGNKNNFVSKYHCERRCRPRCKIPNPCDRIRCRKHQVCKIYKPTGQPYCADTCNNFTCPSGYKCVLRKVFCVRAPCPPVAKCVKIPPADPCELPVVKGPCKAYIPRFFFNKATGKCQRFVYGGCGGNSNNFRSLRDCRRRCAPPGVCRLPLDVGPCDGTNPRWGFNVKSGKCEQFNWGGCQGNRNRFVSEAACKAQCPTLPKCKQPKFSCKTGANCVCTAQVRYFFNQKSGACEQYPADECPLNDNTFNSRTECETTCPVQRCKLHPDVGPCDCHTIRWYFDHQLGYCRRFKYGGCRGNSNNFLTYDACKTACHPDPCTLPLIRGRGAERHVRFYHNPKTRICESFEYSGQDANENNFHTLEDCENRCPPPRNCSGCTGPLSLTKTDVTRDVLEENVQNGWCCATHSTAARLCCCPATSDRASSCQNGGVWVATRPKAEEPDEVDLVEEDLEVPEFADPLDEETGTLLED